MAKTATGESSAEIRKRVIAARKIQQARFCAFGYDNLHTNSQLSGDLLEKSVPMNDDAKELLLNYANRVKLSARGYNRTLKLARTIADLQNEIKLHRIHIAEALSLRWKAPDYKI